MAATDSTTGTQRALAEVAYHHDPYWTPQQSNLFKSLLLFFDGISLLVPDYMREAPLLSDPALAQPLADQGLLHVLSPEALIDRTIADDLTDLLDRLINGGVFDELNRDTAFSSLSHSRLGGGASAELAEIVLEQLRERGLAKHSTDGVSVPLHPTVRTFVLVVLPQLLRGPAEAAGLSLQPVSTRTQMLAALHDTLRIKALPSAGHVVALDLEQVSLDLSSIPIDEVLDFRRQHGAEHRAYARDLRRFARELASLRGATRQEAFADRREELADTADYLRKLARRSWRRPLATVGIGLAGSAVSFAAGNPAGGALGGIGALLGLRRQADPASTYTYLFRAQDRLHRS
jgi:hypothetical protein